MKLTCLEFTDKDFDAAHALAKTKGRADENCAYTSSGAVIGIQYLRRWNGDTTVFCIIKTEELGFLVIQDLEDLMIRCDMERRFPHIKIS